MSRFGLNFIFFAGAAANSARLIRPAARVPIAPLPQNSVFLHYNIKIALISTVTFGNLETLLYLAGTSRLELSCIFMLKFCNETEDILLIPNITLKKGVEGIYGARSIDFIE